MNSESAKQAKRLLSLQSHYCQSKDTFISNSTEKAVSHNMERLGMVSARLNSLNDRQDYDNVNGKQVVDFLHEAFDNGQSPQSVLIKRTSLRLCCYSLSGGELPFLKYVLDVLDCNWTYSYIYGLFHSLLKNWFSFEIDEKRHLGMYLNKKVQPTDAKLRKSLEYITEKGPYKLGYALFYEQKSVVESVSVFNLPRNRFSYSYFDDCIVGYYENMDVVDVDDLRNVIVEHNHISVSKIVLPDIIVRYNSKKRTLDHIAEFAIQTIGDPFLKPMWVPTPGMNPGQSQKLEKARQILVSHLTGKVITQFFRKLTYDENRLYYWLKKVNIIDDFRVYGSRNAKYAVSSVVDADVVNSHFVMCTGSNVKETCALMMFIKDYVIIEFTDVGALYVYRTKGLYFSQISAHKSIQRIDELKMSEMPPLVDQGYNTSYNIEGRMVHIGRWQQRLDSWFKRRVF